MRKIIFIFSALLIVFTSEGQELKAKVTITTTRVSNNVNRSAFKTLETALTNFLNNRKWTADVYGANEKIECNFFMNLESTSDLNVYSASLMIQAARPVFNSSYLAPLVNFKDDNVLFKYQEFQQLDFNENRVTGNDAQMSNLTAIFAYYAYMIIGFDALSFAPNGGEVYFQKAQNIVNNAPEGKDITGWKSFDGIRNRYWLVENMRNSRFTQMQEIYYNYYRKGMDKLYDDEKLARAELLKVLQQLEEFNVKNPNTMINQFFFQGKSTELIKIFSKASPADKSRALEILSKVDITNAGKYKAELK